MRFNQAAFNRLLSATGGGLGQRVAWRPAAPCPCADRHSGQPRVGCPIGDGRGGWWGMGGPAWTGLAGQKATRSWASSADYLSGDVVVTIPSDSPLWAAGERDRVTFNDSSQPFHQQMRRGENDQLGPAHRAATLERVSWIVAGALVDVPPFGQPNVILNHKGKPYLHADGWAYQAPPDAGEVQFPSVRADGTLVWANEAGPQRGEGYVVEGRCRPEYFFFTELPSDRAHSGGMPLPRRCVLRLFDMAGR
jgi:hypothetical protein